MTRARWIGAEELALYNQVTTFYALTVNLGPADGNANAGATQIRPEPFVLRRITWATTGDTTSQSNGAAGVQPRGSVQGRVVRVRWGDAFTAFLGQRSGLVSAVFGDSNGFLDFGDGVVFGGKQNLEVGLERLFYPGPFSPAAGDGPVETRWDFVFAGVSLLPKPVQASGSE